MSEQRTQGEERAPLRGKASQEAVVTVLLTAGERKVAGSPETLHDTPKVFKTKRCTNHNTETY